MNFMSSSAVDLPSNLCNQINEYRYKVFIEKLGWQLDTPVGIERDEFDTPETSYVVAQDDDGSITGCARLLPTTSPYLLEKVFPELLNGMKPPKSADTWEVSRFTAINLSESEDTRSQFSSSATLALLDEVVEYAKKQGVKRLISVSPISIERLLRNTKYEVHSAGPPISIDGFILLACWIDID